MAQSAKVLPFEVFVAALLSSIFALPAKSLDVVATPDPTHAVTQTIPASTGGTITATGADGTVFTLTIPGDALLADEEITLTPVVAVTGVPLTGGVAAAVQLSPEGLQLLKPAQLTITPPVGIPNVGFSYHGGGQEFFFYPLNLGTTIGFSILHFSGYGMGSGTVTATVTPTNPEDKFLNDVEQSADSLISLSQNYYSNTVAPQVNAAQQPGATVAQMSSAFVTASKFAHMISVMGLDTQDPFTGYLSALSAAMDALEVAIFNRVFDVLCIEPGPAPTAALIGVVRYFLMTGRDPAAVLGADYWDKVTRCAPQVQVDFDSEINNGFTFPGPVGIASNDSVVNALGLRLSFDTSTIGPGAFWFIYGAPLNYVSLTFHLYDPFCTSLASNTGSVISVSGFPDYNLFDPPSDFRIRLAINPITHETFNAAVIGTDGCVVVGPPGDAMLYSAGFFVVGGRNLFAIPLNTPMTFMRTGSFGDPSGYIVTSTEVNTTVTVTSVRP